MASISEPTPFFIHMIDGGQVHYLRHYPLDESRDVMEWSRDRDKVIQTDIDRMLALFEKIREVDTEGVEPMHTLPYEGALSVEAFSELTEDGADVPERTVDVRKLNAPHMRGALFEVPYTLDGEAGKNG